MVWVYGKRLAHEASFLRFRPPPALEPPKPTQQEARLNPPEGQLDSEHLPARRPFESGLNSRLLFNGMKRYLAEFSAQHRAGESR